MPRGRVNVDPPRLARHALFFRTVDGWFAAANWLRVSRFRLDMPACILNAIALEPPIISASCDLTPSSSADGCGAERIGGKKVVFWKMFGAIAPCLGIDGRGAGGGI